MIKNSVPQLIGTENSTLMDIQLFDQNNLISYSYLVTPHYQVPGSFPHNSLYSLFFIYTFHLWNSREYAIILPPTAMQLLATAK